MQPKLHTQRDIYSKPFPYFGRPKVIGYIGLENLMYAKYVQNKEVSFDLNLLIEKALSKPHDLDVKLTDLINFLLEHEARLNFHLESDLIKAKIFCYRGLMTCLACTPYENNEPWKIVVILYRGNIFLCARETEEKKKQKCNMTEQMKKFIAWGYKFEEYLLSDSPETEPNPHTGVDENKEFSLVFTTNLNQHTLVYGAEIDGMRCDKDLVPPAPSSQEDPNEIIKYLSNKEYVELKTSRHIEFPRQEKNFRCFKAIKWWCQSFLVGIDTILCGFRNDAGIVEELKIFPVRDVAKMSERFWSPNVCFNFLDTFFTYVKGCLAREIKHKHGEKALTNIQSIPMITLLLEWKPGMPVQVSENFVYEEDPILPQHFLETFGTKF